MGYTHYWEYLRDPTPAEWRRVVDDTRELFRNLPERSENAGGYYASAPLALCRRALVEPKTSRPVFRGRPVVNEREIHFDGAGVHGGTDLAHCTFHLKRHADITEKYPTVRRMAFVPTARLPYDLVVCGVLLVAFDAAPGAFHVKSDGTPDDWEPARVWASHTLGRTLGIPGVTSTSELLSAHERLDGIARQRRRVALSA